MWSLRDKLLKPNMKANQTKSTEQTMRRVNFNRPSCDGIPNELKQASNSVSFEDKTQQIEDSKSQHSCNVCSRLFSQAQDLKNHILVHTTMEAFEKEKSTMTEDSEGKLNTCLKPFVTYTCEICSRSFKAKDSFERHKRIHSGARPFQCSECSKQFRDSGGLGRHVKEVHAKIRNHPCNICDKWFTARATLEDHIRTHTGERPYVCHRCGIMFKSKASLYQHNKTHSNIFPHICVYCGKGFRRNQQLLAHIPTHTNDKSHICEKCGKGFCTRSELQRHIVVHSDERPFTCLTCGMSFSQKRYLKNHVKLRHGRTDDVQTSGFITVNNLTFS